MKSIFASLLFTFFLASNTAYAQCEYTFFSYDWSICNNGVMVDLYLAVEGIGLGNQGINVTYENNTYLLPTNEGNIPNINISGPAFTIEICSVEFPTCCITKTFDNGCRTDCEISNVATDIQCGENGGYLNVIKFTPEGNDLGNEGFTVTIDGSSYSSSNFNSITLNNIFIPAQTFTYTICSNETPTCCATFTMENPCFVPCDLSSVDIIQTCSNDTLTAITFEPSGINLGIDGFSITLDGDTYSTSGTSLTIDNLNLVDPVIEYTICCNEYPGFCHTFEFENECFGFVPQCNITNVNTIVTCTSPTHYKLTMTPQGTNMGSQGYRGTVNDIAFNKNMATVNLDSLAIDSLIIYTICSNATPNCCYTDTLVNPCYIPAQACSILGASATITCDTANKYSITITPSVSAIDTMGYYGFVNGTAFNQDSTTIVLHNLSVDSFIVYNICSVSKPDCCYSDTIVNPCFIPVVNCQISGVTSHISCDSNSYAITLTPEGTNLGNLGFTGFVNNVAFTQDSSTIYLDSLTTDSLITYTICSIASPQCCYSYTFVNPCINPPVCSINQVNTSLVCNGTYIENIVFQIAATNSPNQGYILYFNGEVYTTTDNLIEVDSLQITSPEFSFTICAIGDSTCCFSDTRLNPCDLNCDISSVATSFNCDTLTLTPVGSNLDSLGFFGTVNGVAFSQSSNTATITNIPTTDSLIVYNICSIAAPTCCYNDTIYNACYASSKPCNLIVTNSTLSNSANGLSLRLSVSQLGTCPSILSVWKDGVYLGAFELENGFLTIPNFTFTSNQAVVKICPLQNSNECVEYTVINTSNSDLSNDLQSMTVKPLGGTAYAINNNSMHDINIRIHTLHGAVLKYYTIPKSTSNYTIHLDDMLPGLYLIQAQIDKNIRTIKLVLTY
jgi:hypothetical protein